MTFHWDDGTPVDRGQDSSFDNHGSRRRKARFGQREAAVCRQAERVLMTELMGIDGATLLGVTAAPDASRLAVAVEADADGRERVLARAGALRTAVARGLTRRKAPELVFVFSSPRQEEVDDAR